MDILTDHEIEFDVIRAIKAALASGRSGLDAAANTWQRWNNGRRDGLNAFLISMVDAGVLQGTVIAEQNPQSRRVMKIHSVIEKPQLIQKDRMVFVVHGRDENLRQAMFQFLRTINLHPMEWRELTASVGTGNPYVGEILDRAFELAQTVIIMLTPDEDVRLSSRLGGGEEGLQARPNVLFEAGLAMGRNPLRTVIVEIGRVRPFSDIGGRHVVRLDDDAVDSVARRQDLAQRLTQAGCKTSLSGTDWHSAGTFRIP